MKSFAGPSVGNDEPTPPILRRIRRCRVAAAFIFGSWAARYEGRSGPAPNDVDVLVIGDPDRDELDRVIEAVEDRLALPVQTTIRNREWWDAGDDALRREIEQRPLVALDVSRLAVAP